VRIGEQVDKDMIAVRIGRDFSIAVVAAPSYFHGRRQPRSPQDLTEHHCINLRLPTHGGFYVWEFRKGRRELKVRVQGRVVFNTLAMIRDAALEGFGLAYLPEGLVEAGVQKGRLVRVLADWCPPRPGFHLYYSSRRQPSPAFALVVDALRHRA
jgi:DNA-binding transcriptional LysR family regulator